MGYEQKKMAADEHADLQVFVEHLPKVELHAHINGSVSEDTVRKLIQLKQRKGDKDLSFGNSVIQRGKTAQSLSHGFEMFKLIHTLCDNEEAAYIVTKDVITEFACDNVKFLELRTTPRAEVSTGMTKETHINSVINAIHDCRDAKIDCDVKLLLSVDRKRDLRDAYDTVKLAETLANKHPGMIIGVDLSGDPTVGDATVLVPVFQGAKNKGLKTTLHLAEIADRNEETLALLKLLPDRVGHGTFLHPQADAGGTQEILDLVTTNKIPLETCITSNICCKTVNSAKEHHFGHWYKQGHPCILCTDDKGVFDSSLSKEYLVAAETFGLSRQQLYELSYSAINASFADEDTKEKLRKEWTAWKKEHEAWFEAKM